MFGLDTWYTVLLLLCILCACAFEFINGFHDTANAVATVIYTNSLRPSVAVVLSATMNSIGVFLGGITVAMVIVNLLPVEALIDQNTWHSISMVLALLITAIAWNLGTWYFGIPCSSSHTLIGSILGVGLSFSYISGNFGSGVNWGKAQEIGLSLLISPAIGFFLSAMLVLILRSLVKNPKLYKEPEPGKKPPTWIRGLLILTCSGVSFSHGSNDGQKGVGLIMLVLIGIAPAYFAIDNSIKPEKLLPPIVKIEQTLGKLKTQNLGDENNKKIEKATVKLAELKELVINNGAAIPKNKAFSVRTDILLVCSNIEKVIKTGIAKLDSKESAELKLAINGKEGSFFIAGDQVVGLKSATSYSPIWVIVIISLSLGLGTMVGWKRIVITIGEKIGKSHLTYAQGASAELVAATTIQMASSLGLPVSTTQVLTGGIAGTMTASGGMKNLQGSTLRNIGIAWLLTLPVTVILSGLLFLLLRMLG